MFKLKYIFFFYFRTSVNCQSSQTSSSLRNKFRNTYRPEKVLQLCKINHGNYFVKLA